MVHRSMRNGSRVADELYIKRVLTVLEDFLFFSLYSFSCIAKQVTTLKQLRFWSCLDFLETNLERLVLFSDITLVLPISPTPDPARYTQPTSVRKGIFNNACQYSSSAKTRDIHKLIFRFFITFLTPSYTSSLIGL